MNLLESVLKILELCSHLIAIARDAEDMAKPEEKAHATSEIWKEIGDIVAKQAAKPEIQGYSEHG